jgi:kumamolisin
VTAVLGTDGPPPVAFRLAAGPIRPLATVGGRFVLTPVEFARIYGLEGLGVDGAGQTIGIVALSRIDPADVAAFRTAFGLPPADLVVVGAVRLPGTAAELEALLDATWSGAVAPRARVEVAAGVIVVDALAHLVDQADVGVISLSLGFCRSPQTKPFVREANRLFRQAAAQGQAVVVASGDTGPFCGGRRGTDELASSPLVTAVGGTTPSPALDAGGAATATGYGTEVVWQDDDGASGGGVTRRRRPAYQRGRPQRTIPDVAFPAASMYPLGVGGRVGCCVGGTSAATPTWAGVAALLAQAEGRRLGPLNPRLYQLGRAQARGGPAAFHDVTEGSNSLPGARGFPARPGYDLATGWGTVAGAVLFDAF